MSGYNAFAEVYDKLTDNIEYKKRADFISTLFERYGVKGKEPILDLACGTGSLTFELAKRGYDMIGIDSSYAMLSQAQTKKYEENADVLFLCQDMTELDLYGTISGAVCMLDSLNHLSCADDVKKTVEKVGLFMEHGGIFIFDVNTIYKHRKILGNNTFVYDCDEVYCVWQNSLNEDDSVDISLDIFECDGDAYYRSTEDFTERAYPIEDYKKWLSDAEFEIVHIFDEMSDRELNEKTERAVFVARYTGFKQPQKQQAAETEDL